MAAGLIGISTLVRPIGVILIVMAPLLLLPSKLGKLRSAWIAIVLTLIAATPTFVWCFQKLSAEAFSR